MNQRSKLNIAVCDDDIFVTEQLSEWIKEYFVSNHLEEPNIYEFDNGENLIKSEVKYDFVFLDIVIPGMNGINIGRRLLEQNEECLIYIITAYDSYLDAAMSLRVFRYISKPLDKSRIYRNIQDGLKIYTTSNTKILISLPLASTWSKPPKPISYAQPSPPKIQFDFFDKNIFFSRISSAS